MRIFVFILVVGFQLSAFAATKYADFTNGDNGNAGTIGSPYKDFRYACTQISGGDTLYLRASTYPCYVSEFFSGDIPSGTPGNPTIISGYPGEVAIYKPDILGHALPFTDRSNIVIQSFSIDMGLLASRDCIKLTTTGVQTGHGFVISNMFLYNTKQGHGFHTSGLLSVSNAAIVTSCTISNIGFDPLADGPFHNTYIQDSNVTVEKCRLIGRNNVQGGGWGVHLFNSDVTNVVISGNFMTNCINGGVLCAAGGPGGILVYNNILVGNGAGVEVRAGTQLVYILNNTFYTNGNHINLLEAVTNIWVENNIFAGSYSAWGMRIYAPASTISVKNNLGYGSYYLGDRYWDYFTNGTPINVTLSGNLFGKTQWLTNDIYNANFVNQSASNFRLNLGSPAIGAGLTQTAFITSYADETRTAPWDMGAYKFNSGLVAPVFNVSGNVYVQNLRLGQ